MRSKMTVKYVVGLEDIIRELRVKVDTLRESRLRHTCKSGNLAIEIEKLKRARLTGIRHHLATCATPAWDEYIYG